METSRQINYPTPLPEDTTDALLMEMLSPAPYKALEKTKKAKGTPKEFPTPGDIGLIVR